MCNQAFVDTIGHQNFLKQACNMNVIKGRCTVPTGESITYPFVGYQDYKELIDEHE